MNLENDSPLRPCGGGGGHHLAHDSRSFGGDYFCPAHLRSLTSDFDPKPNDVVKLIDGDRRPFVVLGRDGAVVTMRHLGSPDAPSTQASVWELYRGEWAAVYRTASRCSYR